MQGGSEGGLQAGFVLRRRGVRAGRSEAEGAAPTCELVEAVAVEREERMGGLKGFGGGDGAAAAGSARLWEAAAAVLRAAYGRRRR